MHRHGLMIGWYRLAGILVLMIGLAHFVMPSIGYATDALAAIPESQRDHFVYLGTYAIGTFLCTFGILTLLSDPARAGRFETAFLALMVLIWAARLVLEFLYPVDLALFFLAKPHGPLAAVILFILMGYGAGLASGLMQRRGMGVHPARNTGC